MARLCDEKHRIYNHLGVSFYIGDSWDRRFILDVSEHAEANNPISTAQGEIILKLISRYRPHLESTGLTPASIDSLLATPVYTRTPYQSTFLPREVRWAGDNKLVFRYKFNQNIVDDIKRLGGADHFLASKFPTYNQNHKLWIVDVNSGNLDRVMDFIKRYKFGFDDTVAQYFMEASNSLGKPSDAKVEDESIVVTVRDDDFLNAWLVGLQELEG